MFLTGLYECNMSSVKAGSSQNKSFSNVVVNFLYLILYGVIWNFYFVKKATCKSEFLFLLKGINTRLQGSLDSIPQECSKSCG